MLEPRTKAKGPLPLETVEDLKPEELESFSVEELLKGTAPAAPTPAPLGNFSIDKLLNAPGPAPEPAAAPAWNPPQVPQAQPPREAPRAAAPAPQPLPAPAYAAPEPRAPPAAAPPAQWAPGPAMPMDTSRAPQDYRAQLDLIRHEVTNVLARQLDDVDQRFNHMITDMHSRLEMAEKALKIAEQTVQRREEELNSLRRENALFRKKLKDLADVRQKMDEVFGG